MKTQSTTENDWPTEAEQLCYWEKQDHGGNWTPDRSAAQEDMWWEEHNSNDFLPRRDSLQSERLISRDRDDCSDYD